MSKLEQILNFEMAGGVKASDDPDFTASYTLIKDMVSGKDNPKEWLKEAALGKKQEEIEKAYLAAKKANPFLFEKDFFSNLEFYLTLVVGSFYTTTVKTAEDVDSK